MSRVRRSAGWVKSGPASKFLPTDPITELPPKEVWNGTLSHLNTLGRIAAARINFRGMDHQEMQEIATSEISYRLALDPATPVTDLLLAGQQAVGDEANSVMSSHGHRRGEDRTGSQFAVYWEPRRVHYDCYGLDRIAARQVWNELDEEDRRMLLVRIAHGTYREMSEDLGATLDTCRRWTVRARQQAMNLWFDWETAPSPATDVKRQSTHCVHGHDLDVHGRWYTDNRTTRKKRRCGECQRIRRQKRTS